MAKVWFVTGSSRGLGRALVEVALEAGDRVAATARNPERSQDLVDKHGDAVFLMRLDVTDYDAAARAVARPAETFDRSGHVFQVASLSVRLSAPGLTARRRSGPSPGSPAVSPTRSLRSGSRSPFSSRAVCAPTGLARR